MVNRDIQFAAYWVGNAFTGDEDNSSEDFMFLITTASIPNCSIIWKLNRDV
jgi:hypothetical protein